MKLQFAWRLRFFSAGGGVWGMYFRGGAYKFGGFASFIRLFATLSVLPASLFAHLGRINRAFF